MRQVAGASFELLGFIRACENYTGCTLGCGHESCLPRVMLVLAFDQHHRTFSDLKISFVEVYFLQWTGELFAWSDS